MRHPIVRGIVAGAAGTTALNAVTYLDMALRARASSTTPEDTVRKVEALTHTSLSARGPDSDAARNRRAGLGALVGITTGVALGALYGVVRSRLPRPPAPLLGVGAGLAATASTAAPMAALGVTDPRTWSATSWLSDLVPHLAYGLVTALVFDSTRDRTR
ncbi:DUF6789 family protein [Actinophytocola sp. NPDC049390]|uniref:DUF6789 family protein n=1 Tax=Actinophytocola sp. NPDC049390 TaxID=3363894 RepID=UPI00378B8949